jgi:hypothetical protein
MLKTAQGKTTSRYGRECWSTSASECIRVSLAESRTLSALHPGLSSTVRGIPLCPYAYPSSPYPLIGVMAAAGVTLPPVTAALSG